MPSDTAYAANIDDTGIRDAGIAAPADGARRHHAAALLLPGLGFDLIGRAAADHAASCTAALAALDATDSIARVQLLSSRAVALMTVSPAAAHESAELAIDLAGRLADDRAWGYALAARSITDPGPEHVDERLEAGRRILSAAEQHDDDNLVAVGYFVLLGALLEKGDILVLDTELAALGRVGTRFGSVDENPAARWFRCLRVILDGDTGAAEQLAERDFAAVESREGTNALAVFTTQLGMIRWMQGRLDEAEEGFLAARREHPEQLIWAASLAWLWLRQGRGTAAASLFATLQDLDAIPRDRYWLSTLTVLAETATRLGGVDFAEELRARLLPFAEQLVPMGVGVAFWGTTARTLGLLEERLVRLEDARRHLEFAVAITRRIGAQAWLAEAQIELAEFGIRNDIAEIPARELLAEALSTSTARGFHGLRSRARQRPRIRVMGRFEVVAVDGERAEWTSRKARQLLKMLVAARGVATSREVYMDALWPGIDPRMLTNRFSVAVNTIRRALDPERTLPTQHHLVVEDESVRLDLENVEIDVERFLQLVRQPDPGIRQSAVALYTGPVFADEPYADWAARLRELAEDALHEIMASGPDEVAAVSA